MAWMLGRSSGGRRVARATLATITLVVCVAAAILWLAVAALRSVNNQPDAADVRTPGFTLPPDGELPDDATVVINTKGPVFGIAAPRTPVELEVTDRDGEIVATADVVAGSDGRYTADLGRHDGRSRRIHAGSVIRIVTEDRRWEVPVELAALLDEADGSLTGIAPDAANITAALHGHGSRQGVLQTRAALADDEGRFTIQFGRSMPDAEAPHRFRGHQADLWARVADGVYLFRSVQTPNLTLEQSRHHAGGGYLLPHDEVTFVLSRDGAPTARRRATADGDGIAQARFSGLQLGDQLSMHYHAADGSDRELRLLPMRLELTDLDMVDGIVAGRAMPSVPLVAIIEDRQGSITTVKGRATSDGTFALAFDELPERALLMIYAVADEELLGVGVDRLHTRIPTGRSEPDPESEVGAESG